MRPLITATIIAANFAALAFLANYSESATVTAQPEQVKNVEQPAPAPAFDPAIQALQEQVAELTAQLAERDVFPPQPTEVALLPFVNNCPGGVCAVPQRQVVQRAPVVRRFVPQQRSGLFRGRLFGRR